MLRRGGRRRKGNKTRRRRRRGEKRDGGRRETRQVGEETRKKRARKQFHLHWKAGGRLSLYGKSENATVVEPGNRRKLRNSRERPTDAT